MKKFGIFLLSLFVAAASLTSCNESSADFAKNSVFAVAHTGSVGLYFESDDHKLLLPTNNRVPQYQPKEGGRVIITYNIVETDEPIGNFDYCIDLYSVSDVRWGDTATVSDAEELKTYGEEPVLLYAPHMISSTTEILNLAINYFGLEASKHTFTLVKNEDPEYKPSQTKDDYLNLELRHKTTETTKSNGYAEWISFELDEFDLSGYKGLIIGMQNLQNSRDYYEVTFTTFNNDTLKPASF